MTLLAYKKSDVEQWESNLTEALSNVRKILNNMEDLKMPETSLEAGKAIINMDYLADWSRGAEAKHRSNAKAFEKAQFESQSEKRPAENADQEREKRRKKQSTD